MNENTLEEAWFLRLSRFSVFMYTSFLIILTFAILTSIIFYTPLKYYLPGYGGEVERMEIIDKSIKIDSLLNHMELQAAYLDVLKGIVAGKITSDSMNLNDSVSLKERVEIQIEKTKAEKEFVNNYESAEKYNLSSLASKEAKKVYVFFKPVKGVISSSYDPRNKQFGVSILTAPHETVVSVLAGTVIYTSYSFNYGWVIHIQHDDNYLSIYKFNTQVLKKVGDVVKAGEVISFTGDETELKNDNHFYFELWKQGQSINPEDVIIF
ncbi:M23 family metallopeptidase [Paludibacter sp.]